MISNKSKWKCNSGWYVHLYSVVYAAQQQGGYHPPFKLRGKLVLLLLLLGFEIFYQKPCRWFDPLFQCVCILKKISLLISSLAAKNHTPSPHKPKSHPLARDWELAHLWCQRLGEVSQGKKSEMKKMTCRFVGPLVRLKSTQRARLCLTVSEQPWISLLT